MAEEVLRLALLPVLVVGPEVTVGPEAEADVRRVLYAADFSPGCGRAMHYAGLLAQAWKAKLLLLHVVEDIWKEPASTRMVTQEFLRMRLLEKGWMKPMAALQPELMVEFGPVEGRILEVAERHAWS
ncbi:MAG TPA: universal stress protein [Acidobacteriaceae bacterium]|nr:universal stress protein [Acidobacteriaceae bacterium]